MGGENGIVVPTLVDCGCIKRVVIYYRLLVLLFTNRFLLFIEDFPIQIIKMVISPSKVSLPGGILTKDFPISAPSLVASAAAKASPKTWPRLTAARPRRAGLAVLQRREAMWDSNGWFHDEKCCFHRESCGFSAAKMMKLEFRHSAPTKFQSNNQQIWGMENITWYEEWKT